MNLKDIAAYTKVSVSTVSRVVNNKDRVDPETRKIVLDALKKFNYIPDETARTLKAGDTRTIGIVVPDISNSFFAGIIRGAQQEADREGYAVMICDTASDPEKEQSAAMLMYAKQVSGLILAPVGQDMRFYQLFRKRTTPVVFIDNLPALTEGYDAVAIDNRSAAMALTTQLLSLGHRRIALITGNLSEHSALTRLSGYRDAFSAQGLPVDEDLIVHGSFEMPFGETAAEHLLALPQRPTALLATNNSLAYGALQTIFKHKLRVPADISVACFDFADPTGLFHPRLTSVNQPAGELGRTASELIIKKHRRKSVVPHEKILLTPAMSEGESCAPPKK